MRMTAMKTDQWMTVQAFIGKRGVTTPEINLETNQVRCQCRDFKLRNSCAHSMYIKRRMSAEGVYNLNITKDAPEVPDEGDLREYILHYGIIVELDDEDRAG